MPPPSHVALWRQTHLGLLAEQARQRFDTRVLALMARNDELTLSLSHLAARGRLSASHIQITRHLPQQGCRLTELAERAGSTKQAMGELVDQCAAWGLVERRSHRAHPPCEAAHRCRLDNGPDHILHNG